MNTRLFPRIESRTVAALVLGGCLLSAAQAIPLGQRDFDAPFVRTQSTSYVVVPTSTVVVNNVDARICVIQFSADAVSSAGDLVGVGYALDTTSAASCTAAGGPSAFTGFGAGTAIWTRTIGAGLHRIRACFALFDLGENGGQATLFNRALTVECATQ